MRGKNPASQAIDHHRYKYREVNGLLTLKFTLLALVHFCTLMALADLGVIQSRASQPHVVMPSAGLEADAHIPLVPVGRVQLPRHTNLLLLDIQDFCRRLWIRHRTIRQLAPFLGLYLEARWNNPKRH